MLQSERLSISNHTVKRYLELLQNTYPFHDVKSYDIRGKAYHRQNAKYFILATRNTRLER